MEKATRRGNYESGSDYVLEYGELRFSFNEQDFAAAGRAGGGEARLRRRRARAARSSTTCSSWPSTARSASPPRSLGEHINEHWAELVGPANRSLVHWIRRLVFRGAWLDQRVKEGELDIVFDADTPHLRLRPARARRGADRALARALLGLASPTGASRRAPTQIGEQLGVRRRRSRSARAAASAASAGVRSASSERSRRAASSSLGLAKLILVRDPALARRAAPGTRRRRPARGRARSASSRSSSPRARPRRRRRPSSSTVAITVSEPAVLGEVAPGAEQALDLGDVAGGDREPRERVARSGSRRCRTRRAGGRARARARRSAPARPGASSAVAIANSATGSASRQAVASSGRSSISSTITLGGRPSRGGRAASARSSVVRPERGGGADRTRWPKASGASRSTARTSTSARARRAACAARAGSASARRTRGAARRAAPRR